VQHSDGSTWTFISFRVNASNYVNYRFASVSCFCKCPDN